VELKRGTQRGNFKNKRGIERGTQEIKGISKWKSKNFK
jgi:hypothetical protein